MKQPTLELTSKSYTRGSIDGDPVLVIYDSETDKTEVIAPKSRWYAKVMAALDLIEAASTPLPAPKLKTVLHARAPKLILPGNQSRN